MARQRSRAERVRSCDDGVVRSQQPRFELAGFLTEGEPHGGPGGVQAALRELVEAVGGTRVHVQQDRCYDPGTRAGRGPRPQMAAHRDMASPAPARRIVRRLPSHSARRRRRRAESTRRARARRPTRSGRRDPPAAATRGAPSPGVAFSLTWRQAFAPASRHFSQRPEPNGDPLPTAQNHLVPPSAPCGRRRTGYGSIVSAWSRGTVIFTGPGAAGMLWDGGRTTGQAGPV